MALVPYQRHHQKQQQKQKEISSSSSTFDFRILQKPFWIWDKKQHLIQAKETNEECCWNHVVGLPRKDGKKEYPLFDYEKTLFYSLIDQDVNNPLPLFEHANPQDIVDLCFDLYRKNWNTWFFVDGANRASVNLMKVAFDESLSWDPKDGINPDLVKVLPVNFATEHKQMLTHLHMLINKEYLAIPKEFDKLTISLGTAYANEYSLDKEQTSYSDSLDALRLACKLYKMK
jgi:hypothetical protein